jgi:hypothetical protein
MVIVGEIAQGGLRVVWTESADVGARLRPMAGSAMSTCNNAISSKVNCAPPSRNDASPDVASYHGSIVGHMASDVTKLLEIVPHASSMLLTEQLINS